MLTLPYFHSDMLNSNRHNSNRDSIVISEGILVLKIVRLTELRE